jgi:hypothetical protein
MYLLASQREPVIKKLQNTNLGKLSVGNMTPLQKQSDWSAEKW